MMEETTRHDTGGTRKKKRERTNGSDRSITASRGTFVISVEGKLVTSPLSVWCLEGVISLFLSHH